MSMEQLDDRTAKFSKLADIALSKTRTEESYIAGRKLSDELQAISGKQILELAQQSAKQSELSKKIADDIEKKYSTGRQILFPEISPTDIGPKFSDSERSDDFWTAKFDYEHQPLLSPIVDNDKLYAVDFCEPKESAKCLRIALTPPKSLNDN